MCKCNEYEEKIKELEKLVYIDPLTEVYNRRYFDIRYREERNRYNRYNNRPFSIVVIDIDNFKNINDRFGHAYGDKQLQLVASTFKSNLRSTDIICRYGGDEFVIIMPEITSSIACSVIKGIKENLDISISIGIAELDFSKADYALCKAKKNKNKIEKI